MSCKELWNDDFSNSVSEKHKLRKEGKQGNTSKGKHLKAKIKARRAVYQVKYKAERKRFRNMRRNDQKCDVFKTAKKMLKQMMIFLVSSVQVMMILYWQSVIKIGK